MPTIRPSADLRNNYTEISKLCHQYSEPIYITKNGKGDLVLLSIEAYERLCGRLELTQLLNEGLDAERTGRVRPFNKAVADIQKRLV